MITYAQHKVNAQKRLNDVPIFFAFSDKQFKEALFKMGNPDVKDLRNVGAGGFMHKDEAHLLKEAIDANEAELAEVLANEEKMIAAIVYELGNHEYCITYDPTDTIEVLDLDMDDPATGHLWAKAEQEYWKGMNG